MSHGADLLNTALSLRAIPRRTEGVQGCIGIRPRASKILQGKGPRSPKSSETCFVENKRDPMVNKAREDRELTQWMRDAAKEIGCKICGEHSDTRFTTPSDKKERHGSPGQNIA